MRIVFLDIDGVLNCKSTRQMHKDFIGIDPVHVEILSRIIKKSQTSFESDGGLRKEHIEQTLQILRMPIV